MRIATWMETFPAISENYILWHIEQLVRGGAQVSLFPANRGDRGKMQPEVEALGLLARVHDTPPMPRGREDVAGLVQMVLAAMSNQPVSMMRLLANIQGVENVGWFQAVQYMSGAPGPMAFDILHGYFGPPGRRAELLRRVGALRGELVTSFLGFDVNVLGGRLGGAYYRRLFDGAARLTVSSEFMRSKLLELGAPSDRVRLLPLGLQVKRFTFAPRRMPDDGVVRLVTVSRLIEVKGLEWGLRGVALAKERGLELRWDIVGGGPLREELERLRAQLGLEREVVFHGPQEMGRVRELLSVAHLCLFPGVRAADGAEEALGGAPIEAQAVGLPVLTTDAGGIAEAILPGRSGLCVRQRDVEAIADGLEVLVRRAEEWPMMGTLGRAHVEQMYDCEALHTRWMALYDEVIS